MSDTDSFIDEVTEEVRRDQLYGYLRKYGWIAVVAVLLIVGSAAYLEWQRSQAMMSARSTGDALLNALDHNDAADRMAALAELDSDVPEVAAVIALLSANEANAAGNAEQAVAALNAVASNGALPAEYRQMAQLKALMLQHGTLSADERAAGYQTMAVPGNPYRMLAAEQLALIAIEQGHIDDSIDQLETIRADAETSAGLRARAAQLIVALGYEPREVNTLPGTEGN